MSANPHGAWVATATVVAAEAGAILLDHLGRVEIEFKGEADLVTAADRASEAHITARLRAAFPDHGMVAEEGSRTAAGSGYICYVDPLDGTTNFAHRLPFFAVSMGLELEGERVAGVVYNPVLRECFTAVRGEGACLNGKPIHVTETGAMADAMVATGFPSRKRHLNPNIHFYHYFAMRAQGIRRCGSAALDLCYTAAGRFDAFWEFNLQPWDTAAGALLVTEAGGRVTDLLGAPYQRDSPEVLASNGPLHAQMVDVFARMLNPGPIAGTHAGPNAGPNAGPGNVPALPSLSAYTR